MRAEFDPHGTTPGSQLEIAHVLFTDIVGYSKLRSDQQNQAVQQLNQVVRGTEQFRRAEGAGKLLRLSTGDGMALVFLTGPDAPILCAVEIAKALKGDGSLPLRMGINSGPVNAVTDVNDKSNVTGAGINLAQRVMDCGDAGHILLSKRVADDLAQFGKWEPHLHELGEVEVKHGVKLGVVNFVDGEVGNSALPEKLRRLKKLHTVGLRRRRMAWALASLVVIGALALGLWFQGRRVARTVSTAPDVSEKSIAVLPLENLSEEKENAFFADGIQDELLSNLAKIKDLKVISRTSVMQYKTNITRNLKEIAQQLGVSNVIEGSVRRSGSHIRVSVQLIDALTDRHIWAQNYDRTLADSLALQGELAAEIAAGVGATLSPEEKARVEATPTKNTAAYEAYLRGRALAVAWDDKPSLEAAIRSFQDAVNLDPRFSLAWTYLSRTQSSFYWNGLDPSAARLTAAKEALDHAVALDPSLPETHLAMGFYRYYGERDFTRALEEFLVAEKSLPNNIDVLWSIGLIQRRLGHWEEAIAAQRRMVELDPRNISSALNLAISYLSVRRFSDVARVADHILAIEPANAIGIGLKVRTLWAFGESAKADSLLHNPGVDVGLIAEDAMHNRRFDEAVTLLAKAAPGESANDKTGRLLSLGQAQQRAGNTAASNATYQEVVQDLTRHIEDAAPDAAPAAELHSNLGIAYAGLGDAASAIAEGKKGLAMQPSSADPFEGPNREEAMAQIYTLLGDADHAMPILERLVKVQAPTEIVPWHLRLDPTWDPLRNDPRFQKIIAGPEPKTIY